MFDDSSPQEAFADKSEDTIAIMSDGSYAKVQLSEGQFTGFTLHEPGGKPLGEYSVSTFETGDTIGYYMIDNNTSKPGALDLTAWYLTKNTQKEWFEIDTVANVTIFEKYSHQDYQPKHLPNGIRCPASKAYEVSQRKLEHHGWTLRAQIKDVNLSRSGGEGNSAHESVEPDHTPKNIMDPAILAKMLGEAESKTKTLDEAEFNKSFDKVRRELDLPQKRQDSEERAAAFARYKAGADLEQVLGDYKRKHRSDEKPEPAATVKRQPSPKR